MWTSAAKTSKLFSCLWSYRVWQLLVYQSCKNHFIWGATDMLTLWTQSAGDTYNNMSTCSSCQHSPVEVLRTTQTVVDWQWSKIRSKCISKVYSAEAASRMAGLQCGIQNKWQERLNVLFHKIRPSWLQRDKQIPSSRQRNPTIIIKYKEQNWRDEARCFHKRLSGRREEGQCKKTKRGGGHWDGDRKTYKTDKMIRVCPEDPYLWSNISLGTLSCPGGF